MIPADDASSPALPYLSALLVGAGEALRLWAVRHIGVISRTRSDRLGPIVRTGPFAYVRNPLYLGNIALWIGFALAANLVWLAPIFAVILGLEYHLIVRWEEKLLTERRGDDYLAYLKSVPRWKPAVVSRRSSVASQQSSVPRQQSGIYSWRETLFSERGTLIAIAAGSLLLWMKTRL